MIEKDINRYTWHTTSFHYMSTWNHGMPREQECCCCGSCSLI